MGDILTTGLQRFGKLLCAQLDLFLQVGGRFLQPAGHVVGLSGERLDLVSSLDGNALAEVAAAEARPRNVWIGSTMRRARNMPSAKASTPRRTSPVRWTSTGVSTNTSQPSGAQSMVVVLPITRSLEAAGALGAGNPSFFGVPR
jgi:hypothetical protein